MTHAAAMNVVKYPRYQLIKGLGSSLVSDYGLDDGNQRSISGRGKKFFL
jgi:hypothetical protein